MLDAHRGVDALELAALGDDLQRTVQGFQVAIERPKPNGEQEPVQAFQLQLAHALARFAQQLLESCLHCLIRTARRTVTDLLRDRLKACPGPAQLQSLSLLLRRGNSAG